MPRNTPVGDAWFGHRTHRPPFPPVPAVVEAVRERGWRVTLCLPALDEEETIGEICRSARRHLLEETGLVGEIIVIDSGSSDGTAAVAAEAGATVHRADAIRPDLPLLRGKGDALWKSLAVATGDVIVWIDADVRNFAPEWVARLILPLLDDEVHFVKAFYKRTLGAAAGNGTGGRVTEILVRPLFNLLVPELARVLQPLAGECAGRTETLRTIPFVAGYGVDACLLVDLVDRLGLDAVAQVDLGERVHRNRDTLELGRMSLEILHGLFVRLQAQGRIRVRDELPGDIAALFPAPDEDPPVVAVRPALADLGSG
ncbi:MAG TPA: glucosyl-3-phosphoglycerate synthase [Actinomycetota bacterium]|nr:glucosyl-3-phosphoglycerate synthase [Actinomycetota bacterium]